MTRWENYLSTAEKIIQSYDGSLPLHHFLKGFFKQHPYMGSRDRRQVSQLVYHYYRLGFAHRDLPLKDRILLGAYGCESGPNELLQFFHPDWDPSRPLFEKLAIHPADHFPFIADLSPDMDREAFVRSYFTQPLLFIRTRLNKQEAIIRLLEKANITCEVRGPETLALPNSTKIDTIVADKSWYEIQDASSQQVGDLFHARAGEKWWDSCAASGGKSILLLDKAPGVQLLVSDVRNSIIQNLHQRFKEAGIRQYESITLDLTAPIKTSAIGSRLFDHIILDAPCSGSGTWGRTPESLSFFKESQISEYQLLQQRIGANVTQLLKPGGSLIYITCSVFRQENEELVAFLEKTAGLKKQEGGVIPGYDKQADTMFAVRLEKTAA